jgi:hypothetical protein
MPGTRRALWVLLLGSIPFWATSCTGDLDDQPAMSARPGATQEGGDGDLIDADEACERIRAAEEDVRRDLNCPDLERPRCPDYILVAGSGCWRYPEESVEACERAIGAYAACADFQDEPCIVTAVAVDPSECGAGTGGSGGTGGMGPGGEGGGGNGGTGGSAGTGGSVGLGGEGGEGGRPSGGEGGQ